MRDRVDPELRESLDRFLAFTGPGGLSAVRDLRKRRETFASMAAKAQARVPPNERVCVEERVASGSAGEPDVRLRVYRPVDATDPLPGLYYLHAGGMVLGAPEHDDIFALAFTEDVGCVTVSPDYRLAPEHPYPAALHDCYAGLVWVIEHADELGIDRQRVAVCGRSAGGGLAAATALLARDRGGPPIAYQMLLYPMLDDRNETPSSREITDIGVWDRSANVEAWNWYLSGAAGSPETPAYAAPARASDLSDLPPAFVDTGELDLFRDENVAYAAGLLHARVPTELHVYAGAYHAYDDLAPAANVSRWAMEARTRGLRRRLHPASAR